MLAAVTFVVTFIYHHNFFYRTGGYLLDAGQNAFLFFRNGVIPNWPAAIEIQFPGMGKYGYNYFQYHTSPTISLFSLASYAFPFDRLTWFSFCVAASYAAVLWAMCSAVDLRGGDRKDEDWVLVGGAAGVVFAFSGFAFSMLGFPHLEICYVAFGLWFLVLLMRGKTKGAAVLFVLACGMREDAGFHLTAILFAFWVAGFFRLHLAAFQRRFLIFAILGFASGVVLMLIQKLVFPLPPGTGSPLYYAFVGEKGLQLTRAVISSKLANLWHHGMLLWLPVALTFAWAAVTKNWVLPLGWLVYVPWFLLNFLSNDPSRQTLTIYHGFPFFFSLIWLVLATPKIDFSMAHARTWVAVAGLSGIAVSSLSGFIIQTSGTFETVLTGMTSLPLRKVKPFEDLGRSLRNHPDVFGRIGVDDSTACMFLDWAGEPELWHSRHHYDTLVFFEKTMFRAGMNTLAMHERLFHFYKVADTNVIVATRHELPGSLGERELFEPCAFWLSAEDFDPGKAERREDGSIAQLDSDGCIVAYGPNSALPPGRYRVTLVIDGVEQKDSKLAAAGFGDKTVAALEVTSHSGNTQLAKSDVTGAGLPATVGMDFTISDEQRDDLIEFRVASRGRGRIVVKSIVLTGGDIADKN